MRGEGWPFVRVEMFVPKMEIIRTDRKKSMTFPLLGEFSGKPPPQYDDQRRYRFGSAAPPEMTAWNSALEF
jgi:hypothetical protein